MRLLTIAVLIGAILGCRPLPPQALRLEDAVIDHAAVWQGEVRINGTVTVKKGGSLTILPGTTVRFERIDRDGDGIGDSELYVEGELLAVGSAAKPIVFTSAAATPQPADWKFVYLDYARKAELRHIVSEYAYSGVQIHFCKARIADSEFRYNVDGIRFSTVNIEATGNRIHHNTHGIRYEERRGSGRVSGNNIVDNEIGIFVVTRAEDRTSFTENNIVSRRYNVKVGLEQSGDVSFPRNWWGSADSTTIRDGFFDQSSDRTLGRVTAPEPLSAPLPLLQSSTP